MLMQQDVHSPASKRDPFHLQTQPLLRACFKAKLDFSSSADDALPGKHAGGRRAKKPRDGSVMKRISGSRGYLSVGSNFALWNRTNDPAKRGISHIVRPRSSLCDPPNHFQ
jgi:hypothetical protein